MTRAQRKETWLIKASPGCWLVSSPCFLGGGWASCLVFPTYLFSRAPRHLGGLARVSRPYHASTLCIRLSLTLGGVRMAVVSRLWPGHSVGSSPIIYRRFIRCWCGVQQRNPRWPLFRCWWSGSVSYGNRRFLPLPDFVSSRGGSTWPRGWRTRSRSCRNVLRHWVQQTGHPSRRFALPRPCVFSLSLKGGDQPWPFVPVSRHFRELWRPTWVSGPYL